ncbi:hypothetical protein V6N13_110463 [Hibiscus sabdariffa]
MRKVDDDGDNSMEEATQVDESEFFRGRLVALGSARSGSRQAGIRDHGGLIHGAWPSGTSNNIGPFGLYLGL